MSLGLGLSYENYNEPGNIQMTEFALTPKFNIVYLLKPHEWEFGAQHVLQCDPVRQQCEPGARMPAGGGSTAAWVIGCRSTASHPPISGS